MKKFFEHFTGYIQTDIFLTAAKLKGWTVDVFFTQDYAFSEITKGDLKYRVCRDSLSFNSNVATRISSNKYLTQLILKKYLPDYSTQAREYEITNIQDETIQTLLDKYKKLVVKPVDENNGVGVTTSLTTLDSVKNAIEKIRLLSARKVLIENHVDTIREYRVIVWKGKAIDVLHRIPAYVTGDGTSTIRTLIEQKNQKRYELFENIFEPIIIDEDLNQLLSKKQLSLDTVLPVEQSLTVKNTCNLSTGGEVKRIDLSQVHPDYHPIFQKMFEGTWMNYCGMDLITPDISQPPVVGQTVINELNGGPGLTLAFYDDLATNRPFYGMFQTLEKMEHDPVRVFTP